MKSTGKKYSNLKDLIRDTTSEEEKEFIEAFEERSARREIIKQFMAMRASQDKSQTDIATAMNCSQSCISKLEAGFDDDLTIGEMRGYLNAVDHSLMLIVFRKNWTLVEQIKFHAHMIRTCLKRLVALAKKDEATGKGIQKFHVETLFNLVKLVADSAKNLPEFFRSSPPQVVEANDANEVDEPNDLSVELRCDAIAAPVS